jgi:hypothetical protein
MPLNLWSDGPMIDGRRIITAVIGGLVFTATVYADMTPVSQSDAKRVQSSNACRLAELQYTNLSSPYNPPSVTELDLWSVEFFPEAKADVSQTAEIQHLQILTNGQGSLNLCLSALIGLGLCSSAHWVKRISFGFVPEWYHNGGPFQIGHSYAVTPESLCPVPVCCFVQPVCTVEDSLPQYRLGTVTSLWRKSQFISDVIASRAPPIS